MRSIQRIPSKYSSTSRYVSVIPKQSQGCALRPFSIEQPLLQVLIFEARYHELPPPVPIRHFNAKERCLSWTTSVSIAWASIRQRGMLRVKARAAGLAPPQMTSPRSWARCVICGPCSSTSATSLINRPAPAAGTCANAHATVRADCRTSNPQGVNTTAMSVIVYACLLADHSEGHTPTTMWFSGGTNGDFSPVSVIGAQTDRQGGRSWRSVVSTSHACRAATCYA